MVTQDVTRLGGYNGQFLYLPHDMDPLKNLMGSSFPPSFMKIRPVDFALLLTDKPTNKPHQKHNLLSVGGGKKFPCVFQDKGTWLA